MKAYYLFQIACGVGLAGLCGVVAWPLPKDSFEFYGCLALILAGAIMILQAIFNLSAGDRHEE